MLWLITVIALWGIIHSILASVGFKDFLRRTLGDGFMKFYRLLYNLFAVVSLLPVLYLMISLPDKTLYQVPPPWSYLMIAGQAISALLLFIAVSQTDVLAFVGLRQLSEGQEKSSLVTNGLYRIVRHPLYTFSLLILWLTPSVTVNTFVVYLALTIYLLIGALFEERKLLREFGQEYASYKSVTPMLIPGLSKPAVQRRAPAGKSGGNK
ncbi:MAG TPA: isoprenylcysteine carboxylmethyltransferase family protein [Anaerolineales bacterium]|nr:isoprenylcysteine carboxylmethyltransferase family protein [Anaerolineales bacterium]